jgi:hypothetical protein
VVLKFPINVFPSVDPTKYHKYKKVVYSEEYVAQNFREAGWFVFEPLQDQGVDRIIIKYVCKNGHTKLNESLTDDCPECKEPPIKITRFLQIKTRKIVLEKNKKGHYLGHTFKPKDFLTDPRIFFLLFSDKTNDFLIFPVLDYMALMTEKNQGYFSTTDFKQGNKKNNSIKFINGKWFMNKSNLDDYLNCKGLEKITDINLENASEFIKKSKDIRDKKISEFINLKYTKTYFGESKKNPTISEEEFNKFKNSANQLKSKKKSYFENLINTNAEIINSLDERTQTSSAKYFEDPKELKLNFNEDLSDDEEESDE